MSSVNKVILVGNLGRDPEVRTTQNGATVCNMTVATTERWKDRNSGEQRERTEWHRIVLWEKLAEIAERYLVKGSKVYLEGQLQTRKWTDQNGQDRYSTEIVLQGFNGRLVLLDARQRNGEQRREPDNDRAQQESVEGFGAQRMPSESSDLDDDIPF